MEDKDDDGEPRGSWILPTIFYLGLGSLGPANAYRIVTEPDYLDRFQWWTVLLLIGGSWLLTGFLVQGVIIAWAGITGRTNWGEHGDNAWAGWLKLGLALVGLGIALIVALLLFSGLTDYLSELDRGTLLIAGLLLMILFALWRIGNQVRRG